MTLALGVAMAGLIVALMALGVARRAARQQAQLTDLYWQLKYDHGEMKAKVFPPEPGPPAAPAAFVPLGDVKRGPRL